MKWSLKELNQASEAPIHFTENLDLNEALKSRRSDIIKVSTVHVDGMFFCRRIRSFRLYEG